MFFQGANSYAFKGLRMTAKQLLSTGVLEPLFKNMYLRKRSTTRTKIAQHIATQYNNLLLLKQPSNMKDPAKEYLKKLQHDKALLAKLKTHKQDVEPINKLIDIKLQVCEKYIQMFREKTRQQYNVNLFFLIINDFLWVMPYKDRIKILTALYIMSSQQKIKYKDWMLNNRNLFNNLIRESSMKRLYRASKSSHKAVDKAFEKSLPFVSLKSMSFLHKITYVDITAVIFEKYDAFANLRWTTPYAVHKNSLRNRHAQSQLEKKMRSYLNNFVCLDPKKLLTALKELRIKNISRTHRSLLADPKFVNAFKMPLSLN